MIFSVYNGNSPSKKEQKNSTCENRILNRELYYSIKFLSPQMDLNFEKISSSDACL